MSHLAFLSEENLDGVIEGTQRTFNDLYGILRHLEVMDVPEDSNAS